MKKVYVLEDDDFKILRSIEKQLEFIKRNIDVRIKRPNDRRNLEDTQLSEEVQEIIDELNKLN